MTGEVMGGFRLKQKLGEGGTGETYLAEHTETGQQAAVKVFFQSMSSDEQLIGKFFAEIRAASLVNHIGVADLYDCGVHTHGRAYVVMEYLAGKTLTDALIELGSVSDIESLADIGWQLATILQAVHESKLFHGALKPDGIFLTFPPQQSPRPLIKLLDFGLAKFSLSVRHSQTGSLLGAPLYMSPEIGRGLGNADRRTDIYSLGCILFEMACGRPPFVREGKGELIVAHATEPAPFVSALEPSFPQTIDTLIGRMLTKNPAARPQTMSEVASVLAKFFTCPSPTPRPSSAAVASPASPVSVPVGMPASIAALMQKGASTAKALGESAPVAPRSSAASIPITEIWEPTNPPVAPTAIWEGDWQLRKQEPTALLLPPDQRVPPKQAPTEYLPDSRPPWVERVRQQTVILAQDPELQPRVRPSAGKSVESSRPSGSRQADSAMRALNERPSGRVDADFGPDRPDLPERTRAIDVPVVVMSALAVLAIGVAVLVFLSRKPAPGATAPEVRKSSPSLPAESANAGSKPPQSRAQPMPATRPVAPPQNPEVQEAAPNAEKVRRRKENYAPGPPEAEGTKTVEGKASRHW